MEGKKSVASEVIQEVLDFTLEQTAKLAQTPSDRGVELPTSIATAYTNLHKAVKAARQPQSQPQPQPQSQSQSDAEAVDDTNWIGLLQSFCQVNKKPLPVYDEDDQSPSNKQPCQWRSWVTIEHGMGTLTFPTQDGPGEATRTFARKQDGKKYAAQCAVSWLRANLNIPLTGNVLKNPARLLQNQNGSAQQQQQPYSNRMNNNHSRPNMPQPTMFFGASPAPLPLPQRQHQQQQQQQQTFNGGQPFYGPQMYPPQQTIYAPWGQQFYGQPQSQPQPQPQPQQQQQQQQQQSHIFGPQGNAGSNKVSSSVPLRLFAEPSSIWSNGDQRKMQVKEDQQQASSPFDFTALFQRYNQHQQQQQQQPKIKPASTKLESPAPKNPQTLTQTQPQPPPNSNPNSNPNPNPVIASQPDMHVMNNTMQIRNTHGNGNGNGSGNGNGNSNLRPNPSEHDQDDSWVSAPESPSPRLKKQRTSNIATTSAPSTIAIPGLGLPLKPDFGPTQDSSFADKVPGKPSTPSSSDKESPSGANLAQPPFQQKAAAASNDKQKSDAVVMPHPDMSAPSSSSAAPSTTSSNPAPSCRAQVAAFCKHLGWNAITYNITQVEPGYWSGDPLCFTDEATSALKGLGHVDRILGKDNAREHIAELLLDRLKAEVEYVDRMKEDMTKGKKPFGDKALA